MKLKQLKIPFIVFGLISFVVALAFIFPKREIIQYEAGKDVPASEISATVHYNKDGFQEKEVKIKRGKAVRFVNDSKVSLRIASDPHPFHTDLTQFDSTLSFTDTQGTGRDYVYRFNKVGRWKYHNHNASSHEGVVLVEE